MGSMVANHRGVNKNKKLLENLSYWTYTNILPLSLAALHRDRA
jgi:hypothetical protein